MTFNLKTAREAYLSGQSDDLSFRLHIPTAQDVAEMSEADRHMLIGPVSDLDKKDGAAADGWGTFEGVKNAVTYAGFEFFGPGEHPLPTRFAIKRAGEEFTGRDGIRDLQQAMDFVKASLALRR